MKVLLTVPGFMTGRRTRRLEPQAMIGPTGDQPFHVRDDRIFVLDILLGRIGVVHAEVAGAAELSSDPEVQADRLRVPNVQIRRWARAGIA